MAFRIRKESSKKDEPVPARSEELDARKLLGSTEISDLLKEELTPEEMAPEEPMPLETLEFQELDTPFQEAEKIVTDPDRKAVQEFLAGSDTAFLQLYAKYESPLLLYCRRMMVAERLAEDVFQEIWIRIFEFRSRGMEINFFKGLLFRTARNLALNTLRLEKYRAGSSEALQTLVSDQESHTSYEQQEIKILLKRALAKLPFEQREAFVLHEYSGYSYSEIAEMMNTSEVNVKVRAYRARTRLKKVITSWLGLAEDDDPSNMLNY